MSDMKTKVQEQPIEKVTREEYKYGFTTDIEADSTPPGLNEDIVRFISAKKKEPKFLLEWRLKSLRHWFKMPLPTWAHVQYPPIDYQDIIYYSAPKQGPKSLDEVDPEILKTFEKLGVPMQERAALAGIAVDAVFDSVSVGTTFKKKLGEMGVIFCSFSDAVQEHPELIEIGVEALLPAGGAPVAALVGRHHVIAGLGERQHHLAPAVGQLGVAVDQQQRRTAWRFKSCFEDVHAQAVDVVDVAFADAGGQR